MAHGAMLIVIARLDPAIRKLSLHLRRRVDARVKPGHDEVQ